MLEGFGGGVWDEKFLGRRALLKVEYYKTQFARVF